MKTLKINLLVLIMALGLNLQAEKVRTIRMLCYTKNQVYTCLDVGKDFDCENFEPGEGVEVNSCGDVTVEVVGGIFKSRRSWEIAGLPNGAHHKTIDGVTFSIDKINSDSFNFLGHSGNSTLDQLILEIETQNKSHLYFYDSSAVNTVYVGKGAITSSNMTIEASPNPVTSNCTINIVNGQGDFDYYLFDTNGNIVLSGISTTNQFDLNLQSYTNGFYFLNITDTNGENNQITLQKN